MQSNCLNCCRNPRCCNQHCCRFVCRCRVDNPCQLNYISDHSYNISIPVLISPCLSQSWMRWDESRASTGHIHLRSLMSLVEYTFTYIPQQISGSYSLFIQVMNASESFRWVDRAPRVAIWCFHIYPCFIFHLAL